MKKQLRISLISLFLLLTLLFSAACSTGESPDTTGTGDIVTAPASDSGIPPVEETESGTEDVTAPPEETSAVDDQVTTPETVVEPVKPTTAELDQQITARAAFLVDADTREVLYMKGDPLARLEPASTTKLLTILYALSVVEDTSIVIAVSDEQELVASDSSRAYVRAGYRLTVEMLIEGMLLPSGNDAAYALAAGVGRMIAGDDTLSGKDAVRVFMEGLNKYGEAIGLKNTHFTCPDGYTDPDHYTCLADMATISILCAQNELILKYTGAVTDFVKYESGETIRWNNTNALIKPDSPYYYPYAKGLKTGTTNAAGCCVIGLAERGGRRVIAGIFGAENTHYRFSEARILMVSELGE